MATYMDPKDSVGHNLTRSFIRDCLDNPKILFHEVFKETRQKMEKYARTEFDGVTHKDSTIAIKRERVQAATNSRKPFDIFDNDTCLFEGSNEWCSKQILDDLGNQHTVPVIWSCHPINLIYLNMYLDTVFAEDADFDEALSNEFCRLLEILSVPREVISEDSRLLGCDNEDKISACCCYQEFATKRALFAHLETTHEMVGEQKISRYTAILDRIQQTSGTTKILIRFGWNNEERRYGFKIE